MTTRAPYNGRARKLVLAFDVGTTFSGVSYSILEPGQIPRILGVMRFPGYEGSKIPTVLYYDRRGKVRAAGAEALGEAIEARAEDEQWTKSEWFKLHLRPRTQSSASSVNDAIIPLPNGKSAINVFADFLRYLYECTRMYIEEAYPNGATIWCGLQSTADFVLAHPNGWEGAQQSLMRQAATTAGLIPDTAEGHSRLFFVSEGEASLHFCIKQGLTNEAIKSGKGIVIVDAGGGTIDVSTYRQKEVGKGFREIAAPQCHFKGSIFVTNHAKLYLEDLLIDSNFFDDVPHIAQCFERTAKLRFRSADDPQFIKFGSARDNDVNLGIRSGQLKLSGPTIASFFDPSIECIKAAVGAQCALSKTRISTVFLVGGFAASDYLYVQLKRHLNRRGLVVSRPESNSNKAVADGAVSFRIDHFVTDRLSKFTFGIDCNLKYEPNNPEHVARIAQKIVDPKGEERIPGFFAVILAKNTTVHETKEFRQPFNRRTFNRGEITTLQVNIICYRGGQALTETSYPLMDKEPQMYTTLCTVEGDTSQANIASYTDRKSRVYYFFEYEVVFSFGLTELKAFIAWKEDGVEKRSPARLIYEPDTVIYDD